MLTTELTFYETHQQELALNHSGKYLLIKNQRLQGIYETSQEAYEAAWQKFGSETFLVQHCQIKETSPGN